jgi:FkbM family methyltransferase
MSFLSRLQKAASMPGLFRNWPSVYADVLAGRRVDRLIMRSGERITGRPDDQLWNHFNAIWLNRCYTSVYSIPRGATVVDVGANIGIFTLLAARYAARVISCEPHPVTFSFLTANALTATGPADVVLMNSAIAANSGRVTLFEGDASTANSIVDSGGPKRGLAVRAQSLGDLFQSQGVRKCDFLKLDCEGSEFEIVKSSLELLRRTTRVISLEYHEHPGGSRGELRRMLQDAGFAVCYVCDTVPMGIMVGLNDASARYSNHAVL